MMPADPADLELLNSGERDLSFCNFAGADLKGMDLRGRNFSRSNLTNADFSDADLRQSVFEFNNLGSTNFSSAKLSGAKFVNCTLDHTILTNSDLVGSLFRHGIIVFTEFDKVDIRGARFDGTSFTDSVNFDGVIYDDHTDFNGSKGTRALSRRELFAGYDFIEGVFRKKSTSDALDSTIIEITQSIDKANEAIENLYDRRSDPLSSVGIGHNGPPEELPIEGVERAELSDSLAQLRELTVTRDIRSPKAATAIQTLERYAKKIALWVAPRVNLAADEFAKQVGRSAGDTKTWLAGWLWVSGQLDRIVAAISSIVM